MRGLVSISVVGLAALLSVAGAAWGAEPAKEGRLCAISEVLDCTPVGDCVRVSAAEAGLPDFLRLDPDGQGLRSAVSDDDRKTTARYKEVTDTGTILVGIENRRGWSAVLADGGRRLIGTAADAEGAFVVFGVCTQP